jgi:hexosaminidase
MLINPTDQPKNETIVLPLYYTGLRAAASITREGDESTRATHQLDARARAMLSYSLPPYGITWFLVEPNAAFSAAPVSPTGAAPQKSDDSSGKKIYPSTDMPYLGFLQWQLPPPAPLVPPPAEIWPLPQKLELSGPPLRLSPDFEIDLGDSKSKVLQDGAERYAALMRATIYGTPGDRDQDVALITNVHIETTSDSEELQQNTSASYSVTVTPPTGSGNATVEINAASPFGALYGLESLTQLVHSGQLAGSKLMLEDEPMYNFRGLMVDTGRRFWPGKLLRNVMDAMAAVKMNVLHLHFVDNCRVAVESKVAPNLTHWLTGDQAGHYTQEQLRTLIEYGHDRGIRVLPEIELPGHAFASVAQPLGLQTCATPDLPHQKGGQFPGPVIFDDPAGDSMSKLEPFILEMSTLFPEAGFHVGGDEVVETGIDTGAGGRWPCGWKNTAGMERKIIEIVQKAGKVAMIWDEPLFSENAATPGTVVFSSDANNTVGTIIERYEYISAVWAQDYLDLKKHFWHSWQDIGESVQNMSATNRSRLLGGETLQWSDMYCGTWQCGAWVHAATWHAPDPPAKHMFPPAQDEQFIKSISAMMWPRAAVAAGSFWRYDKSLDINGSRFRSIYKMVNERLLLGRGVASCPTGCECNETAACGKLYPLKTDKAGAVRATPRHETLVHCSLNGAYTGGSCTCDPGWRGRDCSQANVVQSEIIYPAQSRWPVPPPLTAAAWGASIVKDETGVYHLFEDVVCQDFSPGFHELNSNIQHATSSSPTGPFAPVGFVVGAATADGHTSICPRIQRAPDGTWLLYHIAMSPTTMTKRTQPANCSGYRPLTLQERRQRRQRLHVGSPRLDGLPKCDPTNNETIRIAHSRSLSGPWELTYFVGNNGSSYWNQESDRITMPWDEGTNCWVDNPGSLVMMDNGTLLFCYELTAMGTPGAIASVDWSGIPVSPQGVGFIASDSGSWRGPWRSVTPGSNVAVGYPSGHEGNAEE